VRIANTRGVKVAQPLDFGPCAGMESYTALESCGNACIYVASPIGVSLHYPSPHSLVSVASVTSDATRLVTVIAIFLALMAAFQLPTLLTAVIGEAVTGPVETERIMIKTSTSIFPPRPAQGEKINSEKACTPAA